MVERSAEAQFHRLQHLEVKRSCFGDQTWFDKLQSLSSLGSGTATLFLVPALSLIYLLGIVVTNVGYILFDWVERKLRKCGLEEDYELARNKLYLSDKTELIEDFKFRRSKVRICRGWFINSFLIILALVASLGAGKIPVLNGEVLDHNDRTLDGRHARVLVDRNNN